MTTGYRLTEREIPRRRHKRKETQTMTVEISRDGLERALGAAEVHVAASSGPSRYAAGVTFTVTAGGFGETPEVAIQAAYEALLERVEAGFTVCAHGLPMGDHCAECGPATTGEFAAVSSSWLMSATARNATASPQPLKGTVPVEAPHKGIGRASGARNSERG